MTQTPGSETSLMPNGPKGYDAEAITVLEGLDAVRKRPGMYIGGTGINALHHLVYEVVDNSIDEVMAGHATTVGVTIQADGSCVVTDDGRGIPVGPMKHENPALNGKPAVEVVMTTLHAGGKFGQEGSAYKVSGGLHGVGVSCVNALSEWLECDIYREGRIHHMEFERGRVSKPLADVGPIAKESSRSTGTMISFLPDAQIFPETTFSFETLANRLREMAFLNAGVTIRLRDERAFARTPEGDSRVESFHADHGLLAYVEHLMTGKSAVCEPVYVKKDDEDRDLVCEIALQYHDGYNETLLTFANNINNVDGGTHAQGFKTALTRTINAHARKAGLLREKDPVPTGDDLREGLIAIVSVKLPDPAFNNQPKEKLLNPEIEAFVAQSVSDALGAWLEERPAEAKRLTQKAVLAAQAREAARKARELTRRKSALDSGSMPHKLRDCKTKDVGRSEIFIVEGDSAGGSATQGRDVETQAILPIKGKIINVEKARIDKVLANEEIRTLITALRCGIGEDFDVSKLRYGKVIIMTDADVDGSHIRTLLQTFFFRQMSELIRHGHVYVAQPPLYQVTKNKRSRYVLHDRALNAELTALGLEFSTLVVRDHTQLSEPGNFVEKRRVAGAELAKLVGVLQRLAELVEIAERRGTTFGELLQNRAHDPMGTHRLPSHRVSWRGGERYAWDEEGAHEIIAAEQLRLTDASDSNGDNGTQADETASLPATIRELHENREIARLVDSLAEFDIEVESTLSLQFDESVSGERLPTAYAWIVSSSGSDTSDEAGRSEDNGSSAPAAKGERVVEVPNLRAIVPTLHEIGRKGLELKRFKGLGEMDAEQLWETTMDPSKRVLMRVTMEQAAEAENLFSTLMGEQVEPRRRYIEDHALEVKNLDV